MQVKSMARSLSLSILGWGLAAFGLAIPVQWYYAQSAPEDPLLVAQVVKPLIWPTRGIISQGFHRYHEGIDIAGPEGTLILAAAEGVVIAAGWDEWGLGNAVTIEHPDGSKTVYGHNRGLYVRRGDRVQQGDVIAEMGSTGNSTGPHLHFEYYTPSQQVRNPIGLLPELIAGEIPELETGDVGGGASRQLSCPGTLLIDAQTRNFYIQVCEVRGQIFYFGQSKADPAQAIRLPAVLAGGSYAAINGNYVYQVDRESLNVFYQNRNVRSEQFL